MKNMILRFYLFLILLMATSSFATTIPVNDDTPRDQYTAGVSQTTYVYDFFIFEDEDLKVYVDDVLQTLTSDYTVTGANTAGGGNVVFLSAPSAGQIVTIEGDVSISRAVDLQQGGKFDPDDYNLEQDKNIVIMKQLRRDVDRKVGLTTTGPEVTAPSLTDLDDGAILQYDEGNNLLTATRTFDQFDTDVATAAAAGSAATTAAGTATTAAATATSAASSATTSASTATTAAATATSAASSATTSALAAGSTLTATSTSSVAIGTGAKTFTTQANKNFQNGGFIQIASAANGSNYMFGQITSYSGTTLITNITDTGGSGTYADWNISVAGARGQDGAGSGSVTSVSVTTANGVSGSVANPTSTPAITLTLGAITPTTIVASSTIAGSNLSGTNTGDQIPSTISGFDESAQDAIGAMVNSTLTYTDGTPLLGINLSNANTWAADQTVPAETYGSGWNGSNEVPTKNDVYDKVETLGVAVGTSANLSGSSVTLTVDFTTYSAYRFYFYDNTAVGTSITVEGSSNGGSSYATTTYRSLVAGSSAGTSTSNLNNSWTADHDIFTIDVSQPLTSEQASYTMVGANPSSTVTGGGNFGVSAALNRIKFSYTNSLTGTIIAVPIAKR